MADATANSSSLSLDTAMVVSPEVWPGASLASEKGRSKTGKDAALVVDALGRIGRPSSDEESEMAMTSGRGVRVDDDGEWVSLALRCLSAADDSLLNRRGRR